MDLGIVELLVLVFGVVLVFTVFAVIVARILFIMRERRVDRG